jgi:hypothetical protein
VKKEKEVSEKVVNHEHGVQGMRILQGLLSLTQKYDSQQIEQATETAWRCGS